MTDWRDADSPEAKARWFARPKAERKAAPKAPAKPAPTRLRPAVPTAAYALLGVAPGVDREALRRAFREAARLAHPDRSGGSHARMVALGAALEAIEKYEGMT